MTEEKHECPPHHFIIDSSNVGHCIYCPAVKNFGKLMRKAEMSVVGSGPASLVETKGKKRGRKKKEELP